MIQPLAYVHPEAKIAQNVVIEPFAIIHKDVEISEGTWIGSHAVINEGARIGKNCKIYPGAVISSTPQDLKFKGEYTLTFIGDNTTIREYATISRGTEEHYKTEIGSDCLIMAYAHVAHDCRIGNHCILTNNVQMAGHVYMGDWAIIGGSSSVLQFTRIGTHAMISGGSLVRKDVPPFTKAAREPLSYGHQLHWLASARLHQRTDQWHSGDLPVSLFTRSQQCRSPHPHRIGTPGIRLPR